MNRCVTKCLSGFCKTHPVLLNHLFGNADSHLTKVFNGAQTGLFAKDALQMGTADRKLLTKFFDADAPGDVGSIVICDSV